MSEKSDKKPPISTPSKPKPKPQVPPAKPDPLLGDIAKKAEKRNKK